MAVTRRMVLAGSAAMAGAAVVGTGSVVCAWWDQPKGEGLVCLSPSEYAMVQAMGDVPVQVGGGVRTKEDVRALLLAGADKVSFNSAAVANPDVIAEAADQFGSQCIVCAIDAKTVSPGKWEIFTHGGRKSTGIDAVEFAKTVVAKGAGEILLTSMDRDGTKAGFNIPLTRAISDAVDVPVIASGGVGNLDHLVEGVTEGGASAVLAASIFHFGEYTIREAKEHMAAAGIPMRLT